MSAPALFTPRFFVMCAFSFTVFFSVFLLLPTTPFHVLDLGGTQFAAGLFLGFLTYASAASAPFTGALADRIGKKRLLVICSLAIACFSLAYALSPIYQLPLALALVHGLFWSGLLSASAAYMTDMIPESRRTEGIGYWGLATTAAIAVAPTVGFWLFRHGWQTLCLTTGALNLVMAGIAWTLPDDRRTGVRPAAHPALEVEWRVLAVSFTLFLYSFGYGGITSFVALYADANGVAPRSLFFTVFAAVILCTRPFSGPLADRIGPRRVFLPCLGLIVAGLSLLAAGGTRPWMTAAAVVFGAGFGTAYPAFVGYLMKHVDPARRGAAFGSILAAFDTGIGTGSIAMGWTIQRHGFGAAFATAAVVAAFALPYFLLVEARTLRPSEA